MIEKLQLQRSFLRKPINSIGIMLAIAFLFEGFGWAASYNKKAAVVHHFGGLLPYVAVLFKSMIVPEVCTLYILIRLIDFFHTTFHIKTVDLNWRAISRYELRILPVLLLAFFAFNPFTQTVRFLLERYPDYSFESYTNTFLIGNYTLRAYIMYLVPVLLIGYFAVNGSLLVDYFTYKEAAEKEAKAELQRRLTQVPPPKPKPKPVFLSTIKGRDNQGEMIFPIEECHYFTVEERYYYAIHAKGRYVISKTLNDLEAELDPGQFFRVNRGVIINRQAVQSYSYWDRGKYIIHLKAVCPQAEISLPRARLQEFRDWLSGELSPGETDTPQDISIPVLTSSFLS